MSSEQVSGNHSVSFQKLRSSRQPYPLPLWRGRHTTLAHRRHPAWESLQRLLYIPLVWGWRGWGTALSGWDGGQPSPRTRRLLAWPPGPGPVLRVASDPVFQAGLEQWPQDAAVPSWSVNDIRKSTLSPAALLTKGHRCWTISGTPDPWGVTGQRPGPA